MAPVGHGSSALNTYFLGRYKCTRTARCSVSLRLTHMHADTDPLTHTEVLTRLMKGDQTKQQGVSGVDTPPTDCSALNNNCDKCDCVGEQEGLLPAVTPQSCNCNCSELFCNLAKGEQSLLISYLSDPLFSAQLRIDFSQVCLCEMFFKLCRE